MVRALSRAVREEWTNARRTPIGNVQGQPGQGQPGVGAGAGGHTSTADGAHAGLSVQEAVQILHLDEELLRSVQATQAVRHVHPGPIGAQSGAMGGQSGPIGAQSGAMGAQGSPLGAQSGPVGEGPVGAQGDGPGAPAAVQLLAQVKQRSEQLMRQNEPNKGGSEYLQWKVANAYRRVAHELGMPDETFGAPNTRGTQGASGMGGRDGAAREHTQEQSR